MNGLSLFSDVLSIYGLRTSFRRSGDAVWQPFSIETPNRFERPRDAAHALVFVGGYRWDGTLLYIDLRDSRVYRCTRESAGPLNSWNSFSHMIGAEAERLSALFDATGRPTDPNASTAPMPD